MIVILSVICHRKTWATLFIFNVLHTKRMLMQSLSYGTGKVYTTMATDLWSPGLSGYDVDLFTSLPHLATSLNDNVFWPSSAACSPSSIDVVQPQLTAFTASTSSPWSLAESQCFVMDDHSVQMSQADKTNMTSNSDGIHTSTADDVSAFRDELDHSFSHLLMTSQHRCHDNINNVTVNWQLELNAD